jgi:hypothetical protein
LETVYTGYMNLDERYWQKRYEQNLTQWDAGAITPPHKAIRRPNKRPAKENPDPGMWAGV